MGPAEVAAGLSLALQKEQSTVEPEGQPLVAALRECPGAGRRAEVEELPAPKAGEEKDAGKKAQLGFFQVFGAVEKSGGPVKPPVRVESQELFSPQGKATPESQRGPAPEVAVEGLSASAEAAALPTTADLQTPPEWGDSMESEEEMGWSRVAGRKRSSREEDKRSKVSRVREAPGDVALANSFRPLAGAPVEGQREVEVPGERFPQLEPPGAGADGGSSGSESVGAEPTGEVFPGAGSPCDGGGGGSTGRGEAMETGGPEENLAWDSAGFTRVIGMNRGNPDPANQDRGPADM